jgi:transposase
MGKPYSLDLRERIIGFVEGGGSRRQAAERFGVSASCAIKLVDRWDQTGSVAPGKRGGSEGELSPHKAFLLGRVKEKPDIMMPELSSAARADYAEAAAVVLTTEEHAGCTYELAGDAAYTLQELAAEILHQTGKSIPYKDIPPGEYAKILMDFGMPAIWVDVCVSSDRAVAQGALFHEGRELSALIGRPTTLLSETVRLALEG